MKLVIRVDAYPELGTGHLMRCIALAQAVKGSGGEAFFVTHCSSAALLKRLASEGFGVHELRGPGMPEDTLEALQSQSPDWVVLDGYHFDTAFQRAVKDAGFRSLVLDDFAHLDAYHADIILNQNYGADAFVYNADPDTRFLLGPDYIILRREFLGHPGREREISARARNLLVTMGGVDPLNTTMVVLDTLERISGPLNVKVVVGAVNPNYDQISAKVAASPHTVEVLSNVREMVPLMAWADAAISAGGTTIWELAYMGLPSLLCIIDESQRNALSQLEKDGIVLNVDMLGNGSFELAEKIEALIFKKLLRDNMHKRLMRLVDGNGPQKIVRILRGEDEWT